jgi:hypothetical protein
VRLRVAGGQVRPRFASEPSEGDVTVEVEGIRIFVAPDVATGDIEIATSAEHETLIVRPLGSQS